MSEHTPGPWETYAGHVYAPGENGANICSVSEPRATSDVRYTPLRLDSPDLAEAHANARLLASAPDLLAACCDALRYLEVEGHGGWHMAGQLRAAIAKARGEA